MFEIQYDNQSVKFLKKIDKNTAKRILDKIDELLAQNMVPSGAKRIIGEHGVFRIRVGDYRVLYRINYEEKKVIIFKIDKRSKVYDQFSSLSSCSAADIAQVDLSINHKLFKLTHNTHNTNKGDNMNITLSVSEDLRKEMNSFPEINWSEVARESIKKKVEILHKFREFTKNSELTEEDAISLGRELNKKLAKRLK